MKPTILLHGGSRSTLLDLEFDEERKQTLNTLVGYGRSLLNDGKDAITVAEAIIVQMEDAPFFNAGKGSALNVNGSHELEAAIMDGSSMSYGAVACVQSLKNPITAASFVMKKSKHSLLVGEAAETHLKSINPSLVLVSNSSFETPHQRKIWEARREVPQDATPTQEFETVGVVVLDRYGTLVSAGSTGGVVNKLVGRVGDTAIAGAGIIANRRVAIACGDGDTILRQSVASRIASLEIKTGLKEAITIVLREMSASEKGTCGVIAINGAGEMEWGSTSRAFLVAGGNDSSVLDAKFLAGNIFVNVAAQKSSTLNLRPPIGRPHRSLVPPKSWGDPNLHSHTALTDPWYKAVLNLQNTMFHATIEFFGSQLGYQYALVPLTTDCISSPMGLGSDSEPVSVSLFGRPTYLSDSMQFSLEYALRVNPLARGFYYVAPSFRGETPDSSHLNQFFHVECELVGGKAKAMEVAERYLMHVCKKILQNNMQELKATAGTTDHIERLLHMMEKNSNRLGSITLDEALDLPTFKDEYWEWVLPESPEHGRKVSRAGEKFLIEYFGGAVWLTEMDHLSVPFYQAFVQDNKAKAKCADLLLGIGETLGLGERHKTKKDIVCALDMHGVAVDTYQWYIDMRDESEGLKTSGWGIGLERFLCWLMAHDDVRDCHIIPRLKGAAFYP